MTSHVLTQEQLEALAQPIRSEIYRRVRALGRATARELAGELGRSPEGLHYHLKLLERADLIREAERRPAPRKPESVYEAVHESVSLPGPTSAEGDRRLAVKMVVNGLRDDVRGFEAAAEAGQSDEAMRRQMHVLRTQVRLTPKDLSTFLDILESAGRFAAEHRSEDGLRCSWSSVVYPHVRRTPQKRKSGRRRSP